jgi:hypothetical protein
MADGNQKSVIGEQQSDSDAWSQSTKRNSAPMGTLYCKDTSKEPITTSLEGMCRTRPSFEFRVNGNGNHASLTYSVVDNEKTNSPLTTAPSSRPASSLNPKLPTITSIDVEATGEEPALVTETWAPTKNEWLIMISLTFISLMVALDATILVTVLPVSPSFLNSRTQRADYGSRR